MPGYYDTTYGQQPSYLTQEDDQFAKALGNMNTYNPQSNAGPQTASAGDNQKGAVAGATAGAVAGSAAGPIGAGIGAVGGFTTAMLAQKAADERARRANSAQIEQQYAQNQNQGYNTMMSGYQGALR